MNIDCIGNRNKVIDLLNRVKRPGMDKLIDSMDVCGFFESPCSTKHHLSVRGGLAEHSLNVYSAMKSLAEVFYKETKEEEIILCALLHDLGKMGDHGKDNYVVNMVKDGRVTKAEPEQKYKQSEAEPFKTNPGLLYIPHEIRSVIIAERYINLTEDEEHAILFHNGMYSDLKYSWSGKERPLDLLLHFADMWCCRVTENEEVENYA